MMLISYWLDREKELWLQGPAVAENKKYDHDLIIVKYVNANFMKLIYYLRI